jgi:hypothetical protein
MNASAVCAVTFALDDVPFADAERIAVSFLRGGLLGATFGVFLWGPALLLTLLLWGLPLDAARRLARRGLSGEDRGEAITGVTCAAWGVVALLWSTATPPSSFWSSAPDANAGAWVVRAASILASLMGAAVAAVAYAREARRRSFLREVEGGLRTDYRVVSTSEGRRLSRIRADGSGYRVADVEEPICELDEADTCLRTLSAD